MTWVILIPQRNLPFVPSLWGSKSLFKLLHQHLLPGKKLSVRRPGCGFWFLLLPRVMLGKQQDPWSFRVLLCKMGLTVTPTSQAACGKTGKYCGLQAPEGKNCILPPPLWPGLLLFWICKSLGLLGLKWEGRMEEELRGQQRSELCLHLLSGW